MIEVERFRLVPDDGNTRRWTIGESIHCHVVEQPDGTWHWAAWSDAPEHILRGDIESGRARSQRGAELLAKQAAVRLLSESLASSESHDPDATLVAKDTDARTPLRGSGRRGRR